MDWLRRTKIKGTKLVFSLEENNLFVVKVRGKDLLFSDQILLESLNAETLFSAIEHLANKHHLVGEKSTLILPESRYQLLMTDKLPVSEEEMTNAVRWKMKGLLDFPLNESTLDTFSVPLHGTGGKRNTVFVTACSKKFIQKCVDAFSKALIPLVSIEISLLALRNLMLAQFPKDKTQLFITVSEGKYSFIIINKHQIYLVRTPKRLNLNIDSTSEEDFFEKVLLEIQRSTDYCLSELKIPAPSDIIFSPHFLSQTALLSYLKTHLSRMVTCLDLNKIVTFGQDISIKQQSSLCVSIGGALQFDAIASERT